MNILPGHISELNEEGKLTIAKVRVRDSEFTSIVINEGNNEDYLAVDHPINVMFKETEVIIGVGENLQISLRNQLPGTITKIDQSDLLCKLTMDTTAGVIKSMITRNAVESLRLQVGKKVVAMIKTNEILLSK
ncbi:MAG: TOBE domain-containing protein [Cyclobacteriaceae bacterium]